MGSRNKIPADPRGGHVRLYWELVDSVAWRALSWADRGLWLALRRKLLGSNNGNIEATLGALRHAGFTSSATLAKGLRALMTAGFIAKTRQGGVAYGQKVCSLYRFTDEAVFDFPKQGIKAMPATNDWRMFTTVAEARAALKAAHAEAKRAPPENDAGLQNAYFSDRGRQFQADRGRQNGVAAAALGKRAGTGLTVAQSSTISLKRAAVGRVSGVVVSPT